MTTSELREALREADARPDHVTAQIRAAYACDRAGEEARAIRYYDAAWQLGVPASERLGFMIGYGSTLRNVGRADDAVAVLGEAALQHGEYAPVKSFLALALLSAGHPRTALATALEVILQLGTPDTLDGYERALAEYHRELIEAELPATET